MWSGDVQSGYSTQWALNPSVYQNMPNEQVDWATLAQQWIKMKETFPVDQIPPAPPPPSIKADIEAGEAPMDMSKDDISPSASASTSQDGSNWGSWNNWQQWNSWGWSGSSGNSTTVPPDKPTPAPPYQYPAPAAPSSYTADIATPTTFDYNHGATIPDNFDQQGYWSGGQTPFIRNKSSDWRADNRVTPGRRVSNKVEEPEPDPNTFLDAAKRKQLPAWIREGLEKMEREKQKKLERERQLKEREEEMAKKQQEEEKAIASGIPVKSKFETDSEDSEKELEDVPVKPRRSRFDATTPSPVLTKPIVANSSPPPVKRKSREELMIEVMQKVRYVLTDILMSVTNDEMRRIGEEVLADFRAKAPATQLRKTPALTSLTGKLGLGIYDSDSQESSESEEEQPTAQKDPKIETDEELRDRINRKRQEFARIEQDIEYQLEQQEERDREREKNIQEEEEEEALPEEILDKAQVEQKPPYSGPRLDLKIEEQKETNLKNEQNSAGFFTPEKLPKRNKGSSEDESVDTDGSSSKSYSSSSSSSSSDHRRSRKSSKKRKEKKRIKRKRKRSSSRSSDRRKSSHRKSSHRYESKHKYDRSRSRSRSRSKGYDDYRHKRSRSPSHRRHSSESSYKHSRRHRSYSRSPDYSRGKKSSHRSRD